MRRIATMAAILALACGLQAQTVVVHDPTSIAQRLLLASQEMDEMIEQKYKFIEQIELLKKSAAEAKKVRERMEKVSNAIRKGHEIVGIMEQAERLMELNKRIRRTIMDDAKWLSDESAMVYIELLVRYASETSEIVLEAKKAVQNNESLLDDTSNEGSGSQEGHKMSDAERIERLRQVKSDLTAIHDNISGIYHRLNAVKARQSRLHFINSLY